MDLLSSVDFVFICLLFDVIVLRASFVVLFDFILRCVCDKLLWL